MRAEGPDSLNTVPMPADDTAPGGKEGRASDRSEASGLADLTSDERSRLKSAGYLYAFSDALWIAQAWLIASISAKLLDGALGGGVSWQSSFWLYPAVFILLGIFRMQLNVIGARRATKAARVVKTRVRTRLLDAISEASPASPLPSSGEVAAHIGDQTDALGPYLARFFPQKTRLSLVPIVILLAISGFSWLGAVILMVTGPIIPVFMAIIGMKAKSASEAQQAELTRMSGFLLDRVRGLETLRLFGAIARTETRIEEVGNSFRSGTMKVLRIAFLSSTVLELFSALGIAFMAVYVGFSLLGDIGFGTWSAPLSFQTGLFILLLVPDFYAPLRAYAAAYHDRAAGLAATERLSSLHADILTRTTGQLRSDGASVSLQARSSAPALVFEDVSLQLGGRAILSSQNFSIEGGGRALLVGPSGAGKTTVLDCFLGLHSLDAGRVLVDGKDLASFNADEWRASVAWVGQTPRLFHGSLRSNLLRGNPGASDAEMWEALGLAGAEALVERLPRGLGTVLGEDGFGLSVGEMRRIGLARAALRKHARLVLADEPTAGLDAETAADVIAGLEKISEGRTFVAATHDPKLMAISAVRIDIEPQHHEPMNTGERSA